MSRIKILAITGGAEVPSAIFRVRQLIPYLKNINIDVVESIPVIKCYTNTKGIFKLLYYIIYLISRFPILILQFKYDYIWLQREILPTFLTYEYFIFKPVILDVDDAIYTKNRGKIVQKYLSKKSKLIFVGNTTLHKFYAQYNKNVHVLPTVVDCLKYRKITDEKKEYFNIGWIGTSSNFSYLHDIEQSLAQFIEMHSNAFLTIVSDMPFTANYIDPTKVNFIQWSYDLDVKMINSFTVGIMPLTINEWSLGKCSLKLIQYLACELPVLVTDTPLNRKILLYDDRFLVKEMKDWPVKLSYLYENHKKINYDDIFNNVKNFYSIDFVVNYISKLVNLRIIKFSNN